MAFFVNARGVCWRGLLRWMLWFLRHGAGFVPWLVGVSVRNNPAEEFDVMGELLL